MATETFNFCVGLNTEGTINQKVQTSDFGDGYSQATAIGINNQFEEWNVNFKGKASYINQVRDFLDRHEGDKSFYWMPPDGKQGRYRAAGYKISPQGNDVYQLTATFTQTFEPASAAASEYVRYVNAIPPDTDGNVTLTAIDVGADDRGAASRAITDLKAETNPLPQYALKSDVPDVSDINIRLNTAEGNITAARSDITSLRSDLTTTSGNLSDLQAQVDGIDTDLTAIKTQVKDQSTQINTLKTSVSTNTTDIDSLNKGRVKTVNGVAADESGNIQLEIDAGSEINDSVTSTNSTWSGQKITSEINAIPDNLVNPTDPEKGSGQISYNSSLDYKSGTAGEAIKTNSSKLSLLTNRVSDLEKSNTRFAIIYPNGGTQENPANINVNQRYEVSNPFTGQPVICEAEIRVNNVWGTAQGPATFPSYGGAFVTANHILESDKIILQTGSVGLVKQSSENGGSLGYPSGAATVKTAPCRIKVWRTI